MTLISNEIYLLDSLKNSFIVSCADRRLTYRNNPNPKEKYLTQKKLFRIEYLNSTVSFWGACLVKDNNAKHVLLSKWLPQFISSRSYHFSLLDFAKDLNNELNERMLKSDLQREPSGFHFAGIRKNGVPEFIHFSNCGFNSETSSYEGISSLFKNPGEDFLGRDAAKFGWNGADPSSFKPSASIQIYRNGDIRAHATVWDSMNKVFQNVFAYQDFRKPRYSNDTDVDRLTRQKLTLISSIYNAWANVKIIGAPWDIEILRMKRS